MLNDFKIDGKKNILCYLNGKHHFELFFQIFKQNPDINFIIFSFAITENDYHQSRIYSLENVSFTNRIYNLLCKSKAFGSFISTDMQPAFAHLRSLRLASLFQTLGVKTIELQHGLFQLGCHYFDVPKNCKFHDDSMAVKTYADHILTYYDIDQENTTTIGYPPFLVDQQNLNTYEGHYNLILSNFHWTTYTDEEKINFYSSVIRLANAFQDEIFIWKFHLGEINNSASQTIINRCFSIFPNARKNIIFAHSNTMMMNASASDLIKKSKKVISTISTVLLDCEIYNKKTLVFESESTKCLCNKLKHKTSFKNYDQLIDYFKSCSMWQNIQTGCLLRYNNEAFRKCIDKFYKEPTCDESILKSIIETFKLLD